MPVSLAYAKYLLGVAARQVAAREKVVRKPAGAGKQVRLREWMQGKGGGINPTSVVPELPVLQVGAVSSPDYRWRGCDPERIVPSDPHNAGLILITVEQLIESPRGQERGWGKAFRSVYLEEKLGGNLRAIGELELTLATLWPDELNDVAGDDVARDRLSRMKERKAYKAQKEAERRGHLNLRTSPQ